MGNSLSIENPAFRCYATCSSVLVMKMLIMAPLTKRQRVAKQVYSSIEDEKYYDVNRGTAKMITDDPDVERVRRAHLNDVENIPAFIFISGLFLLTGPSPSTANMLIKTYTGCRLLHTLVYAVRPMPQPTRGIVWGVGYGITFYMAAKVAMHFLSYNRSCFLK